LLRLAYFSPLPPQRTGIADYSRELLPHLARQAEITLFTDQPEGVAPPLRQEFVIKATREYPDRRWSYDIAVYQMGNSAYHEAMYQVMLRHPGIMVLHEYTLHHFIASQTIERGDFAGYIREMGYALGGRGLRRAREVQHGLRPPPFFEVPLNNRLWDLSLGIIVHSGEVLKKTRRQDSYILDVPVQVVPAPIGRYPSSGASLMRKRLGWPEDALIFASVGLVTAAKRLDMALRAFDRLQESYSEVFYLIVGDVLHAEVEIRRLLEDRADPRRVRYIDFVESLEEFVGWITAADVIVNLRDPTAGETSATALRALAAGRPLIVFDHGWYAELPDDVCVKVPVRDEESLSEAMRQLADNAALRRQMGVRAARYAREIHDPARTAQAYMAFIDQVLAGLKQ